MKGRIVLTAAVVVLVVGYLWWVMQDPVAVGFLALALAALVFWVLLIGTVVAAASLMAWAFLSRASRDFYRERRIRFVAVVVFCLAFFAYVGFVLNRHWLPHRMHPISLVVDFLVTAYTLFLAWVLLRPSRYKVLVAVPTTAGVAIVTLILVVIAPSPPQTASSPGTDKLASLGYVTWVPVEGEDDKSGVVYNDTTRAYAGINVYGPRNVPRAYLMDMDGNILHTWERYIEPEDNWNRVELYPNGDLLVECREELLILLDWDSNIKWVRLLRCHHDLDVAENGDVYVLTRSPRVVRCHGFPLPILDDEVTILNPDGSTQRVISMWDTMGGIVSRDRVWHSYWALLDPRTVRWFYRANGNTHHVFEASTTADVFHTNTIGIIERDIDDVFRRGNLIVCSRTQNTVAVIDPERGEPVWTWGRGELEWPHNPHLLDNGNLLIFDNGSKRGYSRIVELDPQEKRIVWEYTAERKQDFFSYTRGVSQRLPNGNTLITNSDSGQVFEVTVDGEVVWEFLNPELNDARDKRSAIARFDRITNPGAYPCLSRLGDSDRQ